MDVRAAVAHKAGAPLTIEIAPQFASELAQRKSLAI
jgi:hypothetical protein